MSTTEPEPRHLHVHLGDLGPGVVHVHIYVGTPNGGAGSEVTVEPAVEPPVEASLKRLKEWDGANADHIQAAYDGLKSLGLTPHPAGSRNPQPGAYIQPYLRWTHPSHPSGSVGYLNAATFSFAGKNDVRRVTGLPGADDKGSEVRFSITSREGVSQALAAVKHIVEGS
jgi:hypothetical protein